MHYQIFVKGLDGTTKCLQTSSSSLEIKTLKEKLSDLLRIPPQFQRLVSGTRQIADEGFVFAEPDGFFPQINVLLRLRAGKGGFGSLLRGAATKAGQKKTNNNDACRDMSGRRLRHVNAEKKLEEWKAEAEERQLEKIAEAYLKKQMKMKKKTDPNLDAGARDVEKYRIEASRAVDMVESAVKDGLLEALKLQRNGKRKMEEDVKVSVKRHKLWMLEEEDEDKDSDEEIEDAKHDEHLMKGNEECGSSHTSNSESASDSGIPSPSEIGSPGSGSCDDREGNVNLHKKKLKSLGDIGNCWDGSETNTELEKEMFVTSVPFEMKNIIHANIHHNSEANVDVKTEEPNSSHGENDSGSGEQKASIDINKEVPVASNSVDGQHIIISHNMDEIEIMSNIAGLTSQIPDSDRTSSDVNCGSESIITNATVEINSVCDRNSNIGEPLNFDTFNTAKDMEVLGLERLKNELQSCGLKCGGSLSERAARLFLLKTITLEKLPKKHFAKSNDVGK